MQKSLAAAVGLLLAGSAMGEGVEFQPLSQQCEEALALSALPDALRGQASAYVWRDDEYVRTVASDGGGFHCIVQRNHPDAIIPECITSTGKDSILEAIKVGTGLVASGVAAGEAEERVRSMIESGEIAGPTGPGVNYMMSAYNRIYSSQTDSFIHFPPHTMFFAPDASAEVVGGSLAMARENKGFPFVVEAGSHSYIVTITERSSESDDVHRHCSGQIDLASDFD